MARLLNTMIAGARRAAREETPNLPAFSAIAAEFAAYKLHRDVFNALMKYEGTYDVDLRLGAELDANLRIEGVSTRCLPADIPFPKNVGTSEYEPFDDRLINTDELSYFTRVRECQASGIEWGPTDEWLIWTGNGLHLHRFWAIGRLSALKQAFPDQATRQVLAFAGIDLSTLRTPLLIARKGALLTADRL